VLQNLTLLIFKNRVKNVASIPSTKSPATAEGPCDDALC